MDNLNFVIQDPGPGTRILKFRGDILTFTLTLSHPVKGTACLRTNIGQAQTARKEIIRGAVHQEPSMGRDWFDIPMNPITELSFRVTLPLCEVGHFEGKCFFLKGGGSSPVWPEGPNIVINVEPAYTCCANIIYNAFARQFGPNKGSGITGHKEKEYIQDLDRAGYTVIPPSGTFRNLIAELNFIIGKLGCRILQLLPIHPTPTTFARMGRFGSPYAALSFTAVDPSLAEFDPHATPLEQFIELVDAVHEQSAKIFIDIAINHTGWAASLHETHPEWLVRDKEGRIEVPGAWGVRWEDLTTLDYSHKDLWQYMANIFITWCRRGVDGFRCDAGYMIPVSAWKYIVAFVRDQYPDTVFLLEGLGGKISVTREILNKANFNWAYSELFQNYNRDQIETYLPGAIEISQEDGITVHFAETHDNIRLASRSKIFARMRTDLCALCSLHGAFGFANGVEWYATEKINVHGASSLSWGTEDNQVENIRRLNTLLKMHPAFHDQTEVKLVQHPDGNYIVLLRRHLPSGKRLLVVANLDEKNKINGTWNPKDTGMDGPVFMDLLTDKEITVTESGRQQKYLLEPGQVLCLTMDKRDIDLVSHGDNHAFLFPERIKNQCLRAKALDVFRFYNGIRDLADFDPDRAARQLAENPVHYCRKLNPFTQESRVTIWQWPRDIRREVMVPPDHFLMVRAHSPFSAGITDKDKTVAKDESLSCIDGTFFALFSPLPPPPASQSYTLKLSVYTPGHCEHATGPLIFLATAKDAMVKTYHHRSELLPDSPLLFLGTNGRGAMMRANVLWGELNSRYDAILAANINPGFPEDRRIMLTRCRAWLVFQGYSQQIDFDCFDSFCFDYNSRGFWRFHVPTGQGEYVTMTIGIEMVTEENAVRIFFYRNSDGRETGKLADHKDVHLILRPDIEDRTCHETTKAYLGPEHLWPDSVATLSGGFTFEPEPGRKLKIRISGGSFIWEPEWQYMVYRSMEAERGLDPDSDLFSPGYFSTYLKGSQGVELTAHILSSATKEVSQREQIIQNTGQNTGQDTNQDRDQDRDQDTDRDTVLTFNNKDPLKPGEAMKQAMDHYVVKRESLNTVIAGYPWFLDWGRDSLIFVRGLIAAGRTQIACSILEQFGQFEKEGTIPNMIQGKSAGNRDTSDAPLWFIVTCSDLVLAEGNSDFLNTRCGDRTIRRILFSIGHSMIDGTPNGIRMDPESCLIFSPAHFTWMDTNHPAGTPREGYPIEIQALWFFALSFLSRIDHSETHRKAWEKKASQAQKSISDLFLLKEEGYLSDCLHTVSGNPANQAQLDDALRPNQLLAVTLGAVTNMTVCRKIVGACKELLVPGAVRSLADRPVQHQLPIIYDGNVLNDPKRPYQGRYEGDEETKRKPAYHNGTAWTWLLPTFCEAWVKAYGDGAKETALAWLTSSCRLINQGCAGHVPEILDGDFPHTPRGCDAQAWGASELLRVWMMLDGDTKK